jgi:hypothetical protein
MKDFVPIKETHQLTELLGFNDYVQLSYRDGYYTVIMHNPTYSQAFNWFREKHQLFPEIHTDCTTYPKYAFKIDRFYGNPKDLTEKEWYWELGNYSDLYRSHDEAQLDLLRELITMVK